MRIILLLSLFFIIIGLVLFIIDAYFIKDKEKVLVKNTNNRFCVLVPARDESRVIENLIVSIERQTIKVNMEDVYVIVESENDETINICKKHNVSYFVRKKLDLKSKGYALMEMVEYLYENNKLYDLYFIFDADNILDENFFKEMLTSYMEGYDITTGYRKSSNINENVISTCSALTFSLINNMLNNNKISKNRTITISGTGYYISSKIMNIFKSFPFHLLTEDYELSVFLSLNNFSTFYNMNAIFYDEQPTSFSESIKQRTRWCFGFLQVRKSYMNELKKHLDNKNVLGEFISIKPYVLMLLGVFLFYIYLLINLLINSNFYLLLIILMTSFIYLILIIFTDILIYVDKDLGISDENKIKTILYNPLFLISYIYCILKAAFSDVSWEKIEHKGNDKVN